MIWSRYNHFFTKESKSFLYNSLSNSLLELDEDSLCVLRCISKDPSLPIEKDLEDLLVRIKAIVASDETEINRIKYKTLAKRFKNDKLILTICPTLACNFRCTYCFEHQHPKGNMSEEIERKIVSYVKNHPTVRSLSVTWFGGEPLMNFPSIRNLSKEFCNLPISYTACIITNGYLLTKEIASRLEELKISQVQITLDGPKEFHDSRRFLCNGVPTFETILSNLSYAAKINQKINFAIRVNLDASNVNQYTELYNKITNLHLSNVTISPSFVVDYSIAQDNKDVLSSEKMRDFLIELSELKGIRYDNFYPSYNRFECALRNMNAFVIGPQGELYKCWNDVGDKTRVYGTIDNELVNEELMFEYLLEADPLQDKECIDCILFPVCGGGCPYHRLWTKNHNTSKSYCPLHKEFLEDFLWAHYKTKKIVNFQG